MSSKQGVNPNAAPFVPRFAAAAAATRSPASSASSPPPQYQASPPSYDTTSPGAPPMYRPSHPPPFGALPPPPPFIPGGALPMHLGRPMYPGVSPVSPPFAPAPPPPPPTYAATSPALLPARNSSDARAVSPGTLPASAAVTLAPQPLPESVAAAPKKPPSEQPIVLLFLGLRGSGKSTQAKLAAEKLNLLFVSAGELIRAKKQPFEELRRLVEENFPTGKVSGSYRGLALDRFIVNGEADVYYLQWALTPALPVPRVFLLLLDWEVGLTRAEARAADDQRVKSHQRRMIEYRAHFDAAENVYAPIKALDRIDCDGHSVEAIHERVMQRIAQHSQEGRLCPPTSALPPAVLDKDIVSICMVSDLGRYNQLKQDIHHVLGTKYTDFAPVSQMSGVIDETTLSDRRQRAAFACSYFVTLKADGQRLIVVKHRTFGVLGLPQKFTSAYDLNALLAAVEWPNCSELDDAATNSPIEWILDCELIKTPGSSVPTIFAFDYIYLHGSKATATRFAHRLEALTKYFAQIKFLTHAPKTIQLKEYRPVRELRSLLPDYKAAPFDVDGIVFQPDTPYLYGKDTTLFKWKPQEKCTVDFRLFSCEEPEKKEGGEFKFEARVQESLVKSSGDSKQAAGHEEVAFPGIEIRIPAAIVDAEGLCDGSIVECVRRPVPSPSPAAAAAPTAKGVSKQAPSKTTAQQQAEIWDFYRNRTDKLVPNRIDVATRIATLKHIKYDALLTFCDGLK